MTVNLLPQVRSREFHTSVGEPPWLIRASKPTSKTNGVGLEADAVVLSHPKASLLPHPGARPCCPWRRLLKPNCKSEAE